MRIILISLAILFILAFQNCGTGFNTKTNEIVNTIDTQVRPAGDNYFFGFSKARVADPLVQQQRAVDANNMVANSLDSWRQFKIETFNEIPTTDDNGQLILNRNEVLKRFTEYAEKLTENDTLVIYSHTHGLDNTIGPGGMMVQGGLLLGNEQGSKLTWSDYANVLLNLKVKNLIVFTMACYSGHLIETLNLPQFKASWENRRAEGRNFVVISSQNSEEKSDPALIEGQIINPMPYSLEKAFLGEADGYKDTRHTGEKDGYLTLGEIVYFTLNLTENAGTRNINKPQGSDHLIPISS